MAEFKALVPLDGSPTSETSLGYLPILQALGDLKVRLIGVAASNVQETKQADSASEQGLRAYLLNHQIRLTANLGAVETIVRNGSASLAIIGEANAFAANVILITTHSRAGLDRWRLGSITEQVARQAYTDVFVVPANQANESPRIESILVPLDGSIAGEVAIPVARQYASSLGANLHLVHVVAPSTLTSGHGGNHHLHQTRATAYLLEKQTEYGVRNAKLSVLSGLPDAAIHSYCESEAIDLVALTPHGGGTGSRVGLGLVAEHVLRWNRPVLLVRSERS